MAPQETRGKLARLALWLSTHPLIMLICILSTLASVPLTLYIFFKQTPSRQLYVHEPAIRSVFVSHNTPSALDVRIKGEPIGQRDVFAVQVAIWNGGNQSIRPENVLEPVVLRPVDGAQILEAKILRSTRDVCEIGVTADADKATVNWRILEQDDGAVVQLLLAGKQSATVRLGGIIETGGTIRYFRENQKPKREYSFVESCAVFAMLISLGPGLLFQVPEAWRKRKDPKGYMILAVRLVLGLGLTLLLVGVLSLWWAERTYGGSVPSRLVEAMPMAAEGMK